MFFKLYTISLTIFFSMDIIWLGLVAKDFYHSQIGGLMKNEVNWIAAIIFYLIFITGLVVFVISPAVEKELWTHALLFGALFGFVCYATYDLTNLAITKNWPLLVTVIDLLWGSILSSTVSVLTYLIVSKIGI